jgi:hypothetical protein
MKISFAITVCNEIEEIKRLVPFLLKHKRINDEIVVLFDQKNGDQDVLDFLLEFNKLPNVQTWRGFDFDNNFADWKNKLNEYCDGDYIFQLDADEMISEYMVKNVSEIISLNPEVELFFIPRVNTVEGITQDHIDRWGWSTSKSDYHIKEKIVDTQSNEYKFLKDNGFIISETEI